MFSKFEIFGFTGVPWESMFENGRIDSVFCHFSASRPFSSKNRNEAIVRDVDDVFARECSSRAFTCTADKRPESSPATSDRQRVEIESRLRFLYKKGNFLFSRDWVELRFVCGLIGGADEGVTFPRHCEKYSTVTCFRDDKGVV